MNELLNPKGFRFELSHGVATLTLDRPTRLNSLTFEIYQELAAFFDVLSSYEPARVVLITGAGRGFCSGGDVQDIISELFARDTKGLLAFTRCTGALIASVRRCRKPVIAAVNGVAVGAGAVLAAACDIRYFAQSARIGFIFPKVGLSGADMGAIYLLPRIVGHGHASELLFTGEIIDANEAARIGLANRVFANDALMGASSKLAMTLAEGPAFAHAMTKQMLETESQMSLHDAIEAEAQAQTLCMLHPDFRAAYDANVSKKTALFEGSPLLAPSEDSQ
ncbi:MAG: enoyl-CoA hydratase family protein [Deltaproteobacteria bacterium]|nr:enoyl-CoA hydratase family protein [Deltaproteobacteria bacterium]